MRSIAHFSGLCDVLTKDLMHSTYSFIRTNTAAAVAWCAGFLTGFLTGAVMCFSHGGVLLLWMFEIVVSGMLLGLHVFGSFVRCARWAVEVMSRDC